MAVCRPSTITPGMAFSMGRDLRSRLRQILNPARYRDVLTEGAPWRPAGSRSPGRSNRIRHAAWMARRMRFSPLMRMLVSIAQAVSWPLATIRPARILARRRGSGVVGAVAIWRCAMLNGVSPLEQFAYRIAHGDPSEANRWFHHTEFCQLNRNLASASALALCDDKGAFARQATGRGIPAPPTLAVVSAGAYGVAEEVLASHAGGVVLKPVTAFRAQGLEAWMPADDATWRRVSGEGLTLRRDALAQRVSSLAARHGSMLLQPLIPAHPVLSHPDLALPPVLRVVTGQPPDGPVALAYATLWYSLVPLGAQQVMGLTVIDVATGCQVVTSVQDAPHFDWLAPLLRLDLGGAPLPFWESTVRAVSEAHAMLEGGAPVVAWDVVISPSGPVVLEGNIGTSIYYQQTVTGKPGAESVLGSVLEAWLDRRGH